LTDAFAGERQRIDKWLWHARVLRTRSSAASLVESGRVRVNGQRIDASSRPVRPGDVVTVSLDRVERILKVVGFVARRGSAETAQALYQDLTAETSLEAVGVIVATSPAREQGSGRPSKQERRAIDRLLGRSKR
jgi:ribosome-associated heat shock protein Hsp15